MSKKYIIRDNEIIYFDEKRGILTIPNSKWNYNTLLDMLMKDDFDPKAFLKEYDRGQDIEQATEHHIKKDRETGKASYKGIEIPKDIEDKIMSLKKQGVEWQHLEKFWENCTKNPNPGSVQQLFAFISHHNLTITPDGCFLAYKAVSNNFRDLHSGTMDNSVGKIVKMNREDVAYDPSQACGSGLHCATLSYAKNFGYDNSHIVVVKVNPVNVVSVPSDSNAEKIRTCEYEVRSVYTDGKPIKEGVVDKHDRPVEMDTSRKSSWSADEVNALRKFVKKSKGAPSWQTLGKMLNRTAESCRKKWGRLSSKA